MLKQFLILVLLFGVSSQDTFAQPKTIDSLRVCLAHFHEKTFDKDFKKEIEKVQLLFANNIPKDSLIPALIDIEDKLLTVMYQHSLLNMRPFKYQIAISFGAKLISLCANLLPPKQNPFYASAINNLGMLHTYFSGDIEEWQQAKILVEKAYEIRVKILSRDEPGCAGSLVNLAHIYWSLNEREKAMKTAEEALALSKNKGIKFQMIYADCLHFLADGYKSTFRYDTAVVLFEDALSERKKVFAENDSHYALYLYNTADMFQYIWKFDKSIALLNEAIDLTIKTLGEKSFQYAYCIEALGGVYYSLAEFNKAIPLYLQAIAIQEELGGNYFSDLALSLHNLATTYQQLGDYAAALPLLQRDVKIAKKMTEAGLQIDYGWDLTFLCKLYLAMGQYAVALPLLEECEAMLKKTRGEGSLDYNYSLAAIADCYEKMGKYDTAISCYKKVLNSTKKIYGETNPLYASYLDKLAQLYKITGKHSLAIQLCRHSLEIIKMRLGDSIPVYAQALNNLGELYMETGKYDSAKFLLTQSLNIRSKVVGNAHPDYVRSLNSIGVLNMASGKNADAELLFCEANTIEIKHILNTYTSLSEDEKLNLIKDNYLQFSYLPSLLCKTPETPLAVLNQVYTNGMIMKGMVLQNQQQVLSGIRKNDYSLNIQLYLQWKSYKSLLGKQYLLPIKDRLMFIDSIKDVTNVLEQQLSRSSAAFRNHIQSETITSKDVSQKLENKQAAIEFIKFRLYTKKWTDSTMYAASILVAGDSVARFIPLCGDGELQRLLTTSVKGDKWAINKLYKGVPGVANADTTANKLYSLIWKPLEKYLTGITGIYYAPVGLLHRIAFKALQCNDTQCLIDKYELMQVLSTRSLVLPPPAVSMPASVSIWGNIQYNKTSTLQGFSSSRKRQVKIEPSLSFYSIAKRALRGEPWQPLPGTAIEMDSVENLFSHKSISIYKASDTSATEENFKALDGKSPEVLHIATHGFFLSEQPAKEIDKNAGGIAFRTQPNAMFRNGLVLSGGNDTWKNGRPVPGKEDGILTAYEIAQMDLSNTNLVVLSACKTALGDLQGDEGVLGLQRAFKMAGVRQIIMSLWQVPDQETVELMTLFYKNLLTGLPTAQSLRLAQQKIKEKYPSPYYWAGFVLVE